jgi:hypothetical protein
LGSLKLGEPLVEAVKAKLQANVAARIEAINNDAALPILTPSLKVPADVDYYTSGLAAIPRAPAYVIAEGPMEVSPDTEGPHSFISQTEIGVWILEEDKDRQLLGKRLQRQVRATMEALWDSAPQEALAKADGSPLAFRLIPLRTQPGRVFDPDQQTEMWRGFYLTIYQVEQLEGS